MEESIIHLHKSRLEEKSNVLLLLIPAIIYILTLGLIMFGLNYQRSVQIASGESSYVLGEHDSLDK